MAQTTVRDPADRDTTSRTGQAWRTLTRLSNHRGHPRRRVLGLSALVAACGVLAQFVIMPPPLYFDPYYVWLGARDWPRIPLDQWPFSEVPHQVTRIGLVMVTRGAQEIFGPGQIAYFVVAAMSGVLFFVGTYLVVRSLFGDVAGVVSALLLIVHPFFTMTNPYGVEATWSAGVILPDMPGAGLFAFGMAALVVASRRTGRAQTRLLLAAGVCFGTSFFIREFLAFLFLAIPAYLALLRIPWRRNVTVGAPMVVILVAGLIHNMIVWGDPLAGLVSAAEHGGQPRDPVTRPLAAISFLRAMGMWHPLGLVFVAALVLTIAGWVVTRDRRLALVLVWFGALFVPLTVLSGMIDPHDISLRGWLLRYWFSVFPALLAGASGSVILLARRLPASWTGRSWPRGAVLPALAGAVATAYVVAAMITVPYLPRDRAWNELRIWLKGQDGRLPVLWADRRLAQTLTFYTRSMWGDPIWHGTIRDWTHYDTTPPPSASTGPMLYTRWRGQESQILGGWRPERSGRALLWRSSDGVLQVWGPEPR